MHAVVHLLCSVNNCEMCGSNMTCRAVLRFAPRYGLTPEQQAEAEAAYDQMVARLEATRAAAADQQQLHQQQVLPQDCDILGGSLVAMAGYLVECVNCHTQLDHDQHIALHRWPPVA